MACILHESFKISAYVDLKISQDSGWLGGGGSFDYSSEPVQYVNSKNLLDW
jgi:hypothetical protein